MVNFLRTWGEGRDEFPKRDMRYPCTRCHQVKAFGPGEVCPDCMPSTSPSSIEDVIELVPPYAPREGWINLMDTQADTTNGIALKPTIEAGIVNALQHECGQTAAEHGFSQDWQDAKWLEDLADKGADGRRDLEDDEIDKLRQIAASYRNNILGTKLMLIVSEMSEALESLRHNGGAAGALAGRGNFGEELADAIVRILDTGTFTKDNLGDELLAKMEINRGRPHMHGNKAM